MTVRDWKFEDILRISQLEEECFKGEGWSYRTLVNAFEGENYCGLVAEENGEIAGYGVFSCACESADLENLLVAEQYRRSGVAGGILAELLRRAKARGVEKMFLEVRVSNLPAMKLYLNFGFAGVYARTRYYSDGEDCLVMCKKLL